MHENLNRKIWVLLENSCAIFTNSSSLKSFIKQGTSFNVCFLLYKTQNKAHWCYNTL